MSANAERVGLAKRPPPGLVGEDCFRRESVSLGDPADGQLIVRITHISLDPAMRGWINEGKSYIAPVPVGATMRAFAAGVVEASKNPKFPVGAPVAGPFGVVSRALSDGKGAYVIDTRLAPPERWIGGLGMPGMTAYFGLLEVGEPKAGETVVVSGAAGAVGGIVGQIAKLKGCRAVGIAGGPDKCRYVVEELGFDACVDYKAPRLYEALKAACPNGIDVDFENVGGDVLDAILPLMNVRGRIAICGLISAYNATELPAGPRNLRYVLTQRLRMQGLIVFDWQDRYPEGMKAMLEWIGAGKLKLKEDVREGGLAAFVPTLNELFRGGNTGKLVLKV